MGRRTEGGSPASEFNSFCAHIVRTGEIAEKYERSYNTSKDDCTRIHTQAYIELASARPRARVRKMSTAQTQRQI